MGKAFLPGESVPLPVRVGHPLDNGQRVAGDQLFPLRFPQHDIERVENVILGLVGELQLDQPGLHFHSGELIKGQITEGREQIVLELGPPELRYSSGKQPALCVLSANPAGAIPQKEVSSILPEGGSGALAIVSVGSPILIGKQVDNKLVGLVLFALCSFPWSSTFPLEACRKNSLCLVCDIIGKVACDARFLPPGVFPWSWAPPPTFNISDTSPICR